MSIAPIKVTTSNPLGRFTFQVAINPDGRQFNIDLIEPQGGHGVAGSYTERLKHLLGHKYEGNKELQAFAEAILVSAFTIYLTLCKVVADCALAGQDTLEEYDLKQCAHEDYITAFDFGCTKLHEFLKGEML